MAVLKKKIYFIWKFSTNFALLNYMYMNITTLKYMCTCLCIKQDEVYKRNILIQVRFVTAYLGGVMALAPCTK